MTDRAKIADVYLRAAKLLEGAAGHGACTAIYRVERNASVRAICTERLRAWFEEDAREHGSWRAFWANNFASNPDDPDWDEVRNARVLMLCFMAIIGRP